MRIRPLTRAGRVLALAAALTALAGTAASADSAWLYPEPTAAQWWAFNGATVMSAFQNGQCTQWAADKRPDIVRRGVEAIVAREIADGLPQRMGDWTAKNWPALAAVAGIPEGRVARTGAVMVLAPGTLGAASTGHVAYVTRVNRDGSFVVSQMHAPVLGLETVQTLPAADDRLAGVTFIYRGAAPRPAAEP